jgi:hypothetical protein
MGPSDVGICIASLTARFVKTCLGCTARGVHILCLSFNCGQVTKYNPNAIFVRVFLFMQTAERTSQTQNAVRDLTDGLI